MTDETKKLNGTAPSPPPESVTEPVRTDAPPVSTGGPAAAAAPAKVPSAVGRYQILGFKGRGGFGTVYVGFDATLNRKVAIKVPHRAVTDDKADHFLREARRLARLRHPGIVTVFDAGIHDGHGYIVSDLIDGDPLDAWIARNRPDPATAARITAGVADALTHAHAQGVVHRDVKPSNVILTPDRRPVLLDFGIALTEDDDRGEWRGMVAGTPGYLSPEQARGESYRLDGRTDVYSLGVVLYEMLVGRRPFRADSGAELLRQTEFDDPPPPRQIVPGLPAELERVCLRALAKQPADRYATAHDFAAALRAAADAADAPTRPTPTPAALACPRCGARGVKSVAACPVCASSANTPPVDTRPLGPGGAGAKAAHTPAAAPERRQVTVMAAGLEWPTGGAATDPEERFERTSAFRAACEKVIRRYEGAPLPAGPMFTACFGYPVALEDAAARAVRAAGDILAAARASRAAGGPQPFAWAAVHTGTAVVGRAGGDPVSVEGDVVTVVTRLEAAARPDTVLATGPAHHLARASFTWELLGTHEVRGAHPVELYRVTGPARAATRLEGADATGLTPLVGRDQEVGLLRDRWGLACEGMGQIVLLVGEPGIGKSRLIYTLKEQLRTDSGATGSPVVEWRCGPVHRDSPLHPAVEYFRRAFELADAAPAVQADRLVAHLRRVGLTAPEQVGVFAALLSVPPGGPVPTVDLGPQRLKERTLAAVADWLRATAAARPTLFVVEDLHWVDATTLEFLAGLAGVAPADPLLVVLTYRPEFNPPWGARAYQTQIALNRLTRRQVGDLMEKMAGAAVPAEVVDQVAARTDGVPLFVEEFTTSVLEVGGSGAVSTLAIPASLQDLLLARLDRLTADREVVQFAAALGREFSFDVLRAVSGRDEAALRAELGKLVAAELLYPKGRPPRAGYLFKHALIRDAAYQSLLKARRQQFHARIADTLVGRGVGTTEPEVVAHHYTEAGRPAEAADYWLKAGTQALARTAPAEATGHLTRGLEVVGRLAAGPDRDRTEAAVQVPLGTALIQTRGYAAVETGATLERARDLCARLGEAESLFYVTWGFWTWRLLRNELDLALGVGADLLAQAETRLSPPFLIEALFPLGCTLYHRGDFTAADRHLAHGVRLYDPGTCRGHARRTGQNSGVTHRVYGGLALWALGAVDRAVLLSEEGVAIAAEENDAFSLAHALNHLSWLLHFCRLGSQALAAADEVIAVCQKQGFTFWEATGVLSRGCALAQLGRTDEGIDDLRRGLAAFRATGAELHLSSRYAALADAYRDAGRRADAQRAIDDGRALVERFNERYAESELLRVQGELARDTGDPNGAEHWFRTALDVARRQQALAWELRVALSLGRLLAATGRRAEAAGLVAGVRGRFGEGFAHPDLLDADTFLKG